ncbi:LOW QUALITY PROTEIN: BRCA2-interacting transcriptional repressor EMSY [Drosophila eugracilis]|uniref:LOW QUALITY PROTEIN: BRCA2-interacting transcriptional repressor EMSY n=1 Tax=Drosophila eugracilis TaxID=29029 RepID=UPI001BDA9827|nr:LOW QUALITY PROTEIN: BRCA2-interacting transcriptional repressor EMSY [Drosophila eugracilis]
MWPQTLEMSRDECRGMLRRLELESYSHVVSVFRAQGALSETKAKLLEELRQQFHINQERHRAEVRRAANDEQLCTIAENVCGPNTWQEWSREGRRPYPLLPRISPQTALSIVANDLAAKASEENAKLATPAETAVHFGEALLEQASLMSLKYPRSGRNQEPAQVIMEEPFKVPDVPNEVKKMTQKRKENESGAEGKPNKKRHMQQPHPQQPHLPVSQQQQQQLSPSSNHVVDDGDPVPAEKRLTPRTLQQRYFYQQQMKHKQRQASKRNLTNSLGSPSVQAGNPLGGRNITTTGGESNPGKRIAAPAKSGRRAQKQLQHQQQQKLQQHQQQKVLMQSPEAVPNHMVVQPHVEYVLDEALKTLAATTPPTPTSTATPPYTFLNDLRPLVTLKPLKPIKPMVYGPQSGSGAGEIGSPTTPGSRGFANSPIVFKEKLQASPVQVQTPNQTTPNKKYVVEERHPDMLPSAVTATPTPISTANLPLAPQIISVQQIPAPPMGAKLRPAVASPTSSTNSTLLPPGSKITPKKFNILEGDAKPKTLPSSAVRLLPYTEPIGGPLSPLKDSRVTPLSSASTVNIIKNIPASSLNNTLITPLPSAGTTMPANLFRAKVTNPQIKAASGSAGGTVIGATGAAGIGGTGTAPQILGNIKLTSSTGGSATIKQVPSSALRNIKICSPNGKVFLQPGKLPAGSIIHKLNNTSSTSVSGTGGVVTTTTAVSPTNLPAREQRISIQKMQILQPATAVGSSSGSSPTTNTTTISGLSSSAKQPSLGTKPTTLTFATAGGGKNNLVFLPASAATGMRALTLATKPKSNVLVIGATTSPATTTSASSAATPNPSAGTKPKPNQLITEDTPIDIINMPIIVADNGNSSELNQATVKNSPLVVFNATDWEMELDQAATKSATTPSKQALDDVIIEEDEDIEEIEERSDQASTMDLNNSSKLGFQVYFLAKLIYILFLVIELHPEDDSAIEYVDMDLEQPIEIESTSNISPETATTTLKAAIVSASPQQQKKLLEQPLVKGAGAATL